MERYATSRPLLRLRGTIAALALLISAAALMTGCGGSSQSVISTGFPQGGGPFSLQTNAASGGGALLLSAATVPTPVFVPAPVAISDADSRLAKPTAAAGGALIFIRGTAYQVEKPTQPANGPFPSPVTLKITYAPAALVDSAGKSVDIATLNIYYFDGAHWVPIQPSDGGFSYTPAGAISTTIRNFTYPNNSSGKEGSGPGYIAVFSAQPPVNPAPAARS